MTCEKHTGLAERMAVVETEVRNNKKLIQDVRNDHEKTKAEITKNQGDGATTLYWRPCFGCAGKKSFAASIVVIV